MDYYVVEFPREAKGKTVPMGIIPYTWLVIDENNTVECLWPQNLRGNTEFEKLCSINIKFKTNSYETALARLKDLEFQSSLSVSQSDEDIEVVQHVQRVEKNSDKRKLKTKSKSRDYLGDSDEDYIPLIPAPRKHGNVTNRREYCSQIKSTQGTNNGNSSDELSSDRILHDLVASQSNTKNKNLRESQSKQLDIDLNDSAEDHTLIYSKNSPEPMVTFEQLSKCCRTTEVFIKNIYTKLEVLSGDVQHLKLLLQHLHSSETRQGENPHLQKLPLLTKVDLDDFNNILNNEEAFAEICTCLLIVGGKDGSDVVRRLLGKIISHELSLLLNWPGRNGKKSFKESTNLVKLIIAVTRRNSICRFITAAEIENIIKLWFRSASDRQGGRDRRRNNID